MKKIFALLLAVLLITGALTACGGSKDNSGEVANSALSDAKIKIPDFSQMTKEQAEQFATDNGLKVKFVYDYYDPSKAANAIVRQSYGVGYQANSGAEVTLHINNDYYKYFDLKIIDEGTGLVGVSWAGKATKGPYDKYKSKGTYIIIGFKNLTSLPKTLVIPETFDGVPITMTQNKIFNNIKVENVVFPSTLKIVGYDIFNARSTNIKNIVFMSEEEPFVGSFTFTDAQQQSVKIYVPDASVETYKEGVKKGGPFNIYSPMVKPYSEVDESIKAAIEEQKK